MSDICRPRVFLPDADAHWVFHVFVKYLLHLGWHSGRKQQRVLVFRHIFQDGVDVFLESHVEHLVGLVEHHPAHVAEVDTVAAYHILQTSRCGHHDLWFLGEGLELQLDARATVHRHYLYLRDVFRIAEQIFGDLHAEFACRAQNQCLHIAVRRVDVLHKRQSESGCLASACLRKPDQISALRQ